MKKQYVRGVLVFIVSIHTASFVTGCATKHKTQTGWVSVTKPPIQVIYVNRHGAVSPKIVHGIIKQVEAFPYHDYKFNDVTGITIDANAHQSGSQSNVSSVSVNNE